MATKDAMTVPSADALFGRSVEPDKPAPIIEHSHLHAAVVVRHRSTRQVKTRTGGSTIHAFALGVAPDAPWFSLWGSANLNSQLRKLRPGAVVLLRYAGQVTNPDETPGAHQWEVRATSAPVAKIAEYLAGEDVAKRMRELTTIIERAGTEDRERRDARRAANEPPPHTDDDFIPF